MNVKRNLLSAWTVLLAFALTLGACSTAPAPLPSEAPPAATAAPPTAVPPTAVPPTATPTEVPPTATPEPSPTPDVAATAAAEATAAMAPIIAKIDDELQKYRLSTETGHLGWVHEPYSVTLTEYAEQDIHSDYPDVIASNFVIHADITWNTTSGLASCGFVVRGSPDVKHGDSYRLYLLRLGPLWTVEYFKNGAFFSNLAGLRDAVGLDDNLDSTNSVTMLVQGSQMGVYANGMEIGTVADNRLTSGNAGFYTAQESGTTTCAYENAWMWVLRD